MYLHHQQSSGAVTAVTPVGRARHVVSYRRADVARAAVAAEADGEHRVSVSDGTGGDPLAELSAAVEVVRARTVDELDDDTLATELEVVERACRQLSARQSRLAAARAARASRRAREAARTAGRNEDAASNAANRKVRRELTDELGWSPSDAKRAVELGRRLDASDGAGRAFDAGTLTARHAQVLADTLRWIEGADQRRDVEARLVALAATEDPVQFGRSCRRILAELEPVNAARADRRRQDRRSAGLAQTEDGMTAVSARLAGVDGELFTTAFHAFRRPNAPGEHRSPEQAGADALVAMARAALDAGSAPRTRGVRPHLTVTIDWETVAGAASTAEGAWTGPLPVDEVRRVLADCSIGRLVLDADQVPLEAGAAVRSVPAGLRRVLQARDGGCIADGCDMAANWCQVMHLGTPYRLNGRLTPQTAGLGCPEHHDAYDHRGWVITWIDDRPILHHPDRPPEPDRIRGSGAGGGRPPDPPDSSDSADGHRDPPAAPPRTPADGLSEGQLPLLDEGEQAS